MNGWKISAVVLFLAILGLSFNLYQQEQAKEEIDLKFLSIDRHNFEIIKENFEGSAIMICDIKENACINLMKVPESTN